MHTSEAEKDWLRRICGGQPVTEQQTAPAKEAEHKPVAEKKANGHGFGDIAGMNELKEFVTEGFINVLKNRKCAEVYGIKPPSMLFYGPAGCGKTFFAEKMAEEIGINFMKIVPDDLACTWVHGTQQKIGEVFKDAEKKAPTLLFFDEFDAMVPKRSGDEANQHYDSEVNEFLCMLNNASERGVYVLAATNHPERIDKAVLRTGRIDEMVYYFTDSEAPLLMIAFFSVGYIFLSGVSYPLELMPWYWQAAHYVVPAAPAVLAFVKLNSMGGTLADIRPEMITLWIQVIVYFLLSLWVFKKKVFYFRH